MNKSPILVLVLMTGCLAPVGEPLTTPLRSIQGPKWRYPWYFDSVPEQVLDEHSDCPHARAAVKDFFQYALDISSVG